MKNCSNCIGMVHIIKIFGKKIEGDLDLDIEIGDK